MNTERKTALPYKSYVKYKQRGFLIEIENRCVLRHCLKADGIYMTIL